MILYFYPKDDTPGCTKEACAFRDAWKKLQERGAVIVGVSRDSVAKHQAFAKEHALPFVLLSDEDGTVAGMYIQFVTAGAPHANAAKLLLDYEYSDEGQLAYAQGFVHPIRTSVKLPAELLAKFPPAEAYNSVHFPKDSVALDKAGIAIADGWALIAK